MRRQRTSRSGRRSLRWSPWPRRLLALALLIAAAVLAQRGPGTAPADAGGGRVELTPVLVAAREIPAGTTITAADLAVGDLPPAAVPAGVLEPGDEPLGRLVAGPVRAGEPITDVRLVGAELTAHAPADTVAVPLRLGDPGVAALLGPGDVIHLYAGQPGGGASLVVPDALILSVQPSSSDPLSTDAGPLLLVAVPIPLADALATAALSGVVAATLVPP